MTKTRLVLDHRFALGDTIVFTALPRDIHRAFPGQYEIMVQSNWTPVWTNNPHVTTFDAKSPKALRLEIRYRDGISEAGKGRWIHMLAWYHEHFRRLTGLTVPVTYPGGDIHLTEAEKVPFVRGRYWVILSGGKRDITAKVWGHHNYQKVVDSLVGFGLRFVQVGATHHDHTHPPLRGALNMIGHTEQCRDLFNLILHADGVICGVTGCMHIAAALGKPCVVVAGGREEPWWEAYTGAYKAFGASCPDPNPPHRYLHTISLIHCCQSRGCWRKRTIPLEPRDHTNGMSYLCKEPVRRSGEPAVPLCLDMIKPDHVIEAVLSYYADGTIPALR